jgi:hypothetical protein
MKKIINQKYFNKEKLILFNYKNRFNYKKYQTKYAAIITYQITYQKRFLYQN